MIHNQMAEKLTVTQGLYAHLLQYLHVPLVSIWSHSSSRYSIRDIETTVSAIFAKAPRHSPRLVSRLARR